MSTPIGDYALLGNLHCAALVSRAGAIDWFCPKRFDAHACFAALLGTAEHGQWVLAPDGGSDGVRDEGDGGGCKVERSYIDDTLVLETCFSSARGKIKVSDFMPLADGCHIVRMVEGISGNERVKMRCAPRFEYGKDTPEAEQCARDQALFRWRDQRIRLQAHGCQMTLQNSGAEAEFSLEAGQRAVFVLTFADADEALPEAAPVDDALSECTAWWRDWTSLCQYRGRWQASVKRSLITLKALAYKPAGGMAAAATTSLPEVPGGPANYDYRYCWLRDAAFALKVLLNAGYRKEACAWRDWLHTAINQHDMPLHALYRVDGTIVGHERELDWLPGYSDSRPVREGNAASDQYQLDVRGELMEVFHLARTHGLCPTDRSWELQCDVLAYLEERWHKPDRGIWEFRTICDHLTHSKVHCWVAFDRSIRDAERFSLPAPVERWKALREEIRQDVLEHGVDPDGGFFTQRYGSPDVDASLLMIPLVGFVPADDPRMLATVRQIEQELCVDGLVRRHNAGDHPEEGAFLPCCFWLADNYWLSGRHKDAEVLFGRLLTLCNDVGLLAEEYDVQGKRLLGNFPQGLTHLGLISTARLIATGSDADTSLT